MKYLILYIVYLAGVMCIAPMQLNIAQLFAAAILSLPGLIGMWWTDRKAEGVTDV